MKKFCQKRLIAFLEMIMMVKIETIELESLFVIIIHNLIVLILLAMMMRKKKVQLLFMEIKF